MTNNLTWPNFTEHLRNLLRELYINGRYADVTLVSEDRVYFKCHKIVLSSWSPTLKTIIDSQQSEQPLIHQTGIHSRELEAILYLMYFSERNFDQHRMEDIITEGRDLDIQQIGDTAAMKNFPEHIQLLFQELYQKEAYADVTLLSQDKIQFKAHKIVLSACSPVLKKIIDINKTEYLILQTDIKSAEMESVLHLMYIGEGKFYQDRIGEFIKVCKELGITYFNTVEESLKRKHEEKKYQCNQCEFNSKKNDNLQIHIQSVHEGIKYPCSQCGYKATRTSYLKIHVQSVHEGIKYPCNQCEYQAGRRKYLQLHIQKRHEGVRYPCNHCEHKAMDKGQLKKHIQYKHEGIRYQCPQCDYQATTQGHLRSHVRSIHEEVKHSCNICGKKFSQKIHMKTHIRSVHDKIKFSCNHCDKKYTQQNHLRTHVKFVHKCVK